MPTGSARISSPGAGLDREGDEAALGDAGDEGREGGGVADDRGPRRVDGGEGDGFAGGLRRRAGLRLGDRRDRRRLDAELRRDAAGEAAELHLGEPGRRVSGSGSRSSRVVERLGERHVAAQGDEVARDADLVGVVDQGLAALGLLDLAGAGEEGVEVAVFGDELGGGLDADAGGAGDVVDRVAGEGLDVDDAVGADAELLDDLVGADRLVLQGVEHDDAGGDELHQVLVGGDDGDAAAGRHRLHGVGRDDVVGLEAAHARCRAG